MLERARTPSRGGDGVRALLTVDSLDDTLGDALDDMSMILLMRCQ